MSDLALFPLYLDNLLITNLFCYSHEWNLFCWWRGLRSIKFIGKKLLEKQESHCDDLYVTFLNNSLVKTSRLISKMWKYIMFLSLFLSLF
jgi:hypothetical protein